MNRFAFIKGSVDYDLDEILSIALDSGIKNTNENNFDIEILFNDGSFIAAWNRNKYFWWLKNGYFIYPNTGVKPYQWTNARPTRATMAQLYNALKEFKS